MPRLSLIACYLIGAFIVAPIIGATIGGVSAVVLMTRYGYPADFAFGQGAPLGVLAGLSLGLLTSYPLLKKGAGRTLAINILVLTLVTLLASTLAALTSIVPLPFVAGFLGYLFAFFVLLRADRPGVA